MKRKKKPTRVVARADMPHAWTPVRANDPYCGCGRPANHPLHKKSTRRSRIREVYRPEPMTYAWLCAHLRNCVDECGCHAMGPSAAHAAALWVCAYHEAQTYAECTTKEIARLLRDGHPGYHTPLQVQTYLGNLFDVTPTSSRRDAARDLLRFVESMGYKPWKGKRK